MSQSIHPVEVGAALTPPPEDLPAPLADSVPSSQPGTLPAGSALTDVGLPVALTGGLLTPGGTPSLAEIETSPLASLVGSVPSVSPLGPASSMAAGASAPPPPAAGPSTTTAPIAQSSEAAQLQVFLSRMTALESRLRFAEQAGDGRDQLAVVREMESAAYQAWLDEVHGFDSPTDATYYCLLVLLRLTTGDIPVVLHQVTSAKASLKAHPFAHPLASLVSAVHEGRWPVVWHSVNRLRELLSATTTTQEAAFRTIFSTLLDVFYGNYQESIITLLEQTYTSFPFVDFAASVDLAVSDVPKAARNLGWKVDEAAGLVLPVHSQPIPGQAFSPADFDRLAMRVLALEQAVRVD